MICDTAFKANDFCVKDLGNSGAITCNPCLELICFALQPHRTRFIQRFPCQGQQAAYHARMHQGSRKLKQAYQHCIRLARGHYENFPTASLLIRSDLRPAVAAIYAFARQADDIADEGDALPEKRLKQLDAWEVLLERCQQEPLDHPVFLALSDAITRYRLPVSALHDLITAFRMDVSVHSYATPDELMFYCRHSANPVGRLMLALHGINRPEAVSASDAICTALQLANFWQDLSRDVPRGRCYLPDAWLRSAGLSSEKLLHGETDSGTLRPALCEAIRFTESLFSRGQNILHYLPFRFRLQIAATLHGGKAILDKVGKSADVLHERPALGAGAWLSLLIPALHDALRPTRNSGIEST